MTEHNYSTIHFIKLMRQYLESGGKDCSAPDFAREADYSEIMRIAASNNCDPFIYHTICKWGAEYGIDPAVLTAYRNRVLVSVGSQLRADAELKEVISVLSAAGIEFILLKGVILSNLYPNPAYRRTVNADIHVSDGFTDRAAEVLTDRGYKRIPGNEKKYGETFRLDGVLTIELHTKLFESFFENKHAAIVAAGLGSPAGQSEIRVFDMLTKTLAPSHFLLYIFCHHAKHFITSGINLRYLLDICIYVNKNNELLNWDFIISSLDMFGIKNFSLHMMYICQYCLGMTDLSFLYEDIDTDTLDMLLYDIIEPYAGKDGAARRASTNRPVTGIFLGGGKGAASVVKAGKLPNIKLPGSKYTYAKKQTLPLPIAWIHKAFSYMRRKMKRRRIISPAERAQLSKDKLELLKRVKIL